MPISTTAPSRTALEWLAKLPATKEESEAQGFDGCAWLTGYFEASARDKADEVYLGLGGFLAGGPRTVDDLRRHIEAHGTTMLEAWASTMAETGADRDPWAREAALQAATAYRRRMEELMATAIPEARA